MTQEDKLYIQEQIKIHFRRSLACSMRGGFIMVAIFLLLTGCASASPSLNPEQYVTEEKENRKNSAGKNASFERQAKQEEEKGNKNNVGKNASPEKHIKQDPPRNEGESTPSDYLKEADLLSKFMLIIKPLQEQREIMTHYEDMVGLTKTYLIYGIPLLTSLFFGVLGGLGYYFVLHKTSEAKEEISRRAQDQIDKTRTELDKAKEELQKAEATWVGLQTKLRDLEQNITVE
jgi:hypothetical protein